MLAPVAAPAALLSSSSSPLACDMRTELLRARMPCAWSPSPFLRMGERWSGSRLTTGATCAALTYGDNLRLQQGIRVLGEAVERYFGAFDGGEGSVREGEGASWTAISSAGGCECERENRRSDWRSKHQKSGRVEGWIAIVACA